MKRHRHIHLQVEALEARENPSLVLLPDQTLTSLRQEASANTPQWQAFKSRLDQNLTNILTSGAYQGSYLSWIADYSLGYQVLKSSDPTTASKYADKAIGLMKSGMHEYQKGDWGSRQFLAVGDGSTKTFTLPNSDFVPSSLRVYVANTTVKTIVRGAPNTQDTVDWYQQLLKVSNTPDGPAAYSEGTDWSHNPNLWNNQIDWSLAGREPAQGSTYYVTEVSGLGATTLLNGFGFTINGNQITLSTAPGANQAVLVEYVYGTHSADGSSLAYQQTSAHDGGFNSIIVDDTYTSRYLGKFISIGYDWLSGYNGFTPSIKAEAADLLVRWSDYIRDNGYMHNAPASNYEAGAYVSRMLTALALSDQGDPNGPRLVSEMTAYRNNILAPVLQNADASLNGGFWSEGWSYGQMATRNLLLAGLAYEEAGLGTATAERQWSTEVIQSLIAAQPTKATIYDGGDWFAYPAPVPQKDLFYLLSASTTDATARSYANYVIQNYPGAQTNDFQDLLYRDPSASASFWGTSPLQYRAQGTGLVTARADWNYNSTWMSFQLGNLLGADHQSYTPGQLEINRGGDSLLANAQTILDVQTGAPKSTYGNTVIIDDNGEGYQNYRYSMGYWYGTPGVITTAYEPTDDYVYVAGDYKAAYSKNTAPGAGGPATKLTRQIVYLRPDYVIVHDRAGTVKDYFTKKVQWNFLNNPTVSGNSFTETVGSSKLFGQTFSATPLTTTAAPVTSGGQTVYEIGVQNSAPTTNVNYTTAFQTAPSSTSSMVSTSRVASVDGRMEGVIMGDQLVLFGTDGAVDLAAGSINYSVAGAGALTHLLTDLTPGAGYQVKVDGVVVGTRTASDQGTITFTTPAGASSVMVILSTAALTATPDTYNVGHDHGLSIGAAAGVLANDVSPTGGTMTASLVTGPSHGNLSFNANGSFTYTPAAGYAGTDTFTYRATDGTATSAPATVTINVQDNAPVAVADSYVMPFGGATISATNGLLANDSDADGDPFIAVLVSGPSHGTAQVNANGSFTYTPADGFSGTDTFTYKATDGIASSAAQTVTITVQDTSPVTQPDAYTIRHDRLFKATVATGVLANDTSPGGQAMTAIIDTRPTHGTVRLNANGSFTYTPDKRYTGTDTFTYRAKNAGGTSAPQTVTITVGDGTPVAAADTYSVPSTGRLSATGKAGLLANDRDPDGDSITAEITGQPAHGRVVFRANGWFTYTPDPGYVGPDSFQYRDHTALQDSAAVTVGLTVLARPQVNSVVINGGAAQRSRVLSVTVTFNMLVALDPGAVRVVRGDGVIPRQHWDVTQSGGQTVVNITFDGAGTQAGSLADGVWSVRIAGARVHRTDYRPATLGATRIDRLYRLFGDADGDRDVDASDEAAFLAALGQTDAASLATFDANGDGQIDAADQLIFARRMGRKF